jgi:hypothetical protein
VVAAVGTPLTASGHGILEVLGLVVAAAGLSVALWIVLRAVPVNADTA